ncbi:MAG: hypothetical protein ACI84K_000381 [Pseudohongiellaceae bacterium]|jgi:hypothetical protein
MSAVHVKEEAQIRHYDGQTRILSERTEIFRVNQRKASEHVDESWAAILLANNEQNEKDTPPSSSLPPAIKVNASSKSSVVAFNRKLNAEQTNSSFTTFDNTKHTNSVGILAARELFEKALQNKGTLLNKRFVLESVLGFGGMGVVYLTKDLRRVEAEDPYPYVATKVLNDDFKNHPDAFIALQQEAVKSQTLSHPNIVNVYDFDRDGNTLYMTMELLRGNPLDKLIKHHYPTGMPLTDSISIFNGLCAGLSCAHKHKLIHSDFKPMNVFITYGQEAKILDFGISRVCSDNDVNQPRFDAGNLGAITLEYASLEMIKQQTPHFSDDVYALACVFYIILTGVHPFNKVPADQALQNKMVPAPIKSLSKQQWKVLKKALAFESKRRYRSVNEFNNDFHKKNTLTLSKLVTMVSITVCSATLGLSWLLT